MSKYTNIPSEICNLFNEKRQEIVMKDFLHLLYSLKIDQMYLGGVKRAKCQLTNLLVFQILILMPFCSQLLVPLYHISNEPYVW